MYQKRIYFRCKNCQSPNPYINHYIVNGTTHPELKEAIYNESIFQYQCLNCHLAENYYHALYYYDEKKKFLIIYCDEYSDALDELTMLHQHHLFDDYTIRWSNHFHTFKEKIQIFDHGRDDRIIEIYKDILMQDYRVMHPDAIDPICFYEITPRGDECFCVLDENTLPRRFRFPKHWYQEQVSKSFVQKMLRYDTVYQLTTKHVRRFMDLKLDVEIVTLQCDQKEPVEVLISPLDEVYVGDFVDVKERFSENIMTGKVTAIKNVLIKDIPYGIQTIRHVHKEDAYDPQAFINLTNAADQMVDAPKDDKNAFDNALDYFIELFKEMTFYMPVIVNEHTIDPILTDEHNVIELWMYSSPEKAREYHPEALIFEVTFPAFCHFQFFHCEAVHFNPHETFGFAMPITTLLMMFHKPTETEPVYN